MVDPLQDWTEGAPGIVLYQCDNCRHIFYFRRALCPACGGQSIAKFSANGQGEVEARTQVKRAASIELSAYAPYTIMLIKLTEGPRIMAHGDQGLIIGDKVSARFVSFGENRLVPFFMHLEISNE